MLLLRIVAGATAISEGVVSLTESGNSSWVLWTVSLLLVLAGVALLLGLITPIAGTVVILTNIVLAAGWLRLVPPRILTDHLLTAFYVMVIAVAAVLLGPGAFSLDARMFGRREIVIPPASDSDRP